MTKFDLIRPVRWKTGVIIASPHSGHDYPEWFLSESRLSRHALRSSEDAFVDRLIASAPLAGAVMLAARVPRSLVDLNRSPDDIDPQVVCGARAPSLNPRTLAGLGVIPRVVGGGRSILRAPITMEEAQRRIGEYWQPYHDALQGLIDEALTAFGGAILIDMHSMPHDSMSCLAAPRPNVVLGDRHGSSASARISAETEAAFVAQGFGTRRNSPFAGAYMTSTYGRPTQNIHVVQVEIDRSLYMNETRISPLPDFNLFAGRIARVIEQLAQMSANDPGAISMAAE